MRNMVTVITLVLFFAACTHTVQKADIPPGTACLEIRFAMEPDTYPTILGVKTSYPQIAVWAVEPDSGLKKTIFVTEKGAKNDWVFADDRPAATPVWNGVRKQETRLDIDGISGATPSGETHSITWPIPAQLRQKPIQIFIEANVSFDYNEHFTDDDDPATGSGVNGQPSLIWKSEIVPGHAPQESTPVLIGHGHVHGRDAKVYGDLSGITTAKDIFSYMRLFYFPQTSFSE